MNNASPTVIGAFVVGAVVLALVGALLFSRGNWFAEKRTFVMYFPSSVNGLSKGAPVKIKGVQIGQVDRIVGLFDHDQQRTLIEVTDPWPRATQVDYQVEVNIVQFDGGKASPGSLVVRWVIYSDSGREERLRHKSQVPVRPEGTDYHAVVAAMNHAVGELSRDIAAALRHLAQHERQPAN